MGARLTNFLWYLQLTMSLTLKVCWSVGLQTVAGLILLFSFFFFFKLLEPHTSACLNLDLKMGRFQNFLHAKHVILHPHKI